MWVCVPSKHVYYTQKLPPNTRNQNEPATRLSAEGAGGKVGGQRMKQLQDGVTSVLHRVVLLQQTLNHFLHTIIIIIIITIFRDKSKHRG